MLFPKKTKYKKKFKGKLIGKTQKGNIIIYGKYAIKALQETRLTSKQIESARQTIVRKMKKLGFLWVRIFPDIPVTTKPTENRMGKGKGSVSFWVAKIKKGQILYEISGIPLESAKKILKAGASKLPTKIKFIYK
uniref:ribosomal protein L16 n=1 Tax=Plasmopara halstedii TaxID=4781 RepID=UPI002027EC9A|nr:ribosomal protein L16 [Plasmopara halstedii]DAZ89083.1 TPA_asm: ribosomal protein L16 [Plasmopara halstedii]